MNQADNGDILLDLWGLPADQLYLEEENIRVLEGSLDAEKFASGKYVIYNQGTNQSGRAAGNIHAGQVLHLSILDPDTGAYAVSYTHLDVYKRQVFSGRGGCRG